MKSVMNRASAAASALSLVLLGAAVHCAAQEAQTGNPATPTGNPASGSLTDAVTTVNNAVQVMHRMEQDPGLKVLMSHAKGVFVIPHYGRGAAVVGGRGGAGVLLVRRNGTWQDPAFYGLGGVSIGAQAGGEGGPIAFVVNSQRALNSFTQNNNWSLNANAGLTVVNWSKKAQGQSRGDMTSWSGAEGLFGGAAVSLTDISFDQDETAAYYGRKVALLDVLNGRVANPHATGLRQALASTATGSAAAKVGGSGTSGATGSGKH